MAETPRSGLFLAAAATATLSACAVGRPDAPFKQNDYGQLTPAEAQDALADARDPLKSALVAFTAQRAAESAEEAGNNPKRDEIASLLAGAETYLAQAGRNARLAYATTPDRPTAIAAATGDVTPTFFNVSRTADAANQPEYTVDPEAVAALVRLNAVNESGTTELERGVRTIFDAFRTAGAQTEDLAWLEQGIAHAATTSKDAAQFSADLTRLLESGIVRIGVPVILTTAGERDTSNNQPKELIRVVTTTPGFNPDQQYAELNGKNVIRDDVQQNDVAGYTGLVAVIADPREGIRLAPGVPGHSEPYFPGYNIGASARAVAYAGQHGMDVTTQIANARRGVRFDAAEYVPMNTPRGNVRSAVLYMLVINDGQNFNTGGSSGDGTGGGPGGGGPGGGGPGGGGSGSGSGGGF